MEKISFRNNVLPLKNILYRLALRITQSEEDAKDIVQDTLLKVWDKKDEWNEIESIEAFSLTICRNLALDRIKKQDANNESLENTVIQDISRELSPLEETLQRDRVELVKRIINALPEKQRSCMQLRDIEGKQYKEIAEVLQITEEQVKVNIFRARKTVKERFLKLDDYGLYIHQSTIKQILGRGNHTRRREHLTFILQSKGRAWQLNTVPPPICLRARR